MERSWIVDMQVRVSKFQISRFIRPKFCGRQQSRTYFRPELNFVPIIYERQPVYNVHKNPIQRRILFSRRDIGC